MTGLQAGLLFGASIIAGAVNSVAGGGSFISFPALLFTGVHPVIANATNTIAVWPGSLASAGAYRHELRARRRGLLPLCLASLAGGVIGALLLLLTPERAFTALIPWLLLVATLLFTFGSALTAPLRARMEHPSMPSWQGEAGILAFQFIVSVYGGYFGAGMGILMLAALALMGMDDIHEMNALKTLLSILINGMAVITFIAARAVVWPQALLMIVGAVAGGYGGAWGARRTDPRIVRGMVIAIGFAMTAYFFIHH